MNLRTILCGALTLLSLNAGAAPNVAVIATDKCDQPTILGHAKNYRQALQSHLGTDLLNEADSISRLGGAPRQFLSLGEVERLLTGATSDVFEGQTARALKTLTGVTEDIERLPPSAARYAALVKVQSLIGHVQLKLSKADGAGEAAATATFERLLRADPKWAPDADLYPPATRNFVAKLRAKAEKKSTRVALSVTTRPSGLAVFVDGKPIGNSPQTILLPAGAYPVEVDWGEGKRGLTRTVLLEGGPASIELDKTFEGSVYPDKLCVRTDGTRKGRLAIAARLTALLGVQTVHAIREEEPADQERFVTAVTLNSSGEERVEGRIKLYSGTLTPAAWESFVSFMITGERPLPPVEALQGPGVVQRPEPVAEAAPMEAVAVAPAPVAARSSNTGLKAAAIVSGVVGLGSAGSALFFGLQASAANQRLSQSCPNNVCPPNDSTIDTNERARADNSTIALATGVTGGVFIVASVVLFIVAAQSSDAPATGLSIAPTPSGVVVRF